MIRVAPEKAQTLGRSIKHNSLRPYAFCVMSESLLKRETINDADRLMARQLHDEAWRMLTEVRTATDLTQNTYLYPSTVAVFLLRQTVRLAPEQLPYRVWQTIVTRRPMRNSERLQFATDGCIVEMAVPLAKVDRERAVLLSNWLPRPTSTNRFANLTFQCRLAAEWIAELHPDQCEASLSAVSDSGMKDRLRINLVKALLKTPEASERALRTNCLLWYPDDEDFGPME
jgi:hypothetical protein